MKTKKQLKIPPRLLNLLICPSCQGTLKLKKQRLACPNCQADYKVEGKMPIMLPGELLTASLEDTPVETQQKLEEMAVFNDIDSYNELMSRPYILALKEKSREALQKHQHRHANILEIGAGISPYLKGFDPSNFIVATDINKSLLNQSQKKEKREKRVNYLVCDAENLPFKNNSFDFIYVLGVLHHLPNQELALKEMKRVLRRKGKIFIEEPTKWSLNLAYYLLRRLALKLMGKKLMKRIIGCGTPHESFISLGLVNQVFGKRYQIKIKKILPLRMPPIKILSHLESPVKLSCWLEKVPIVKNLGTIALIEIKDLVDEKA